VKPAFADHFGPFALVAGASRGLGLAFARAIAARGVNLVLVSENEAELAAAAASIEGVEVQTFCCDLKDADAPLHIDRFCRPLDVGLLVCNATHVDLGPFLDHDLDTHLAVVAVNCAATTALCHLFGQRMAQRGRGGIVLMSSLTAFMGTPCVSVYGASKAFDLALAEGIGNELEGLGVHVLACAPGAVATPNYLASIPDGVKSPAPLLQPDDVAEEALDSLGVRRVRVPGAKNRLLAFLLSRLLPRQLAVRIMGSATRKLYGNRSSGKGERP